MKTAPQFPILWLTLALAVAASAWPSTAAAAGDRPQPRSVPGELSLSDGSNWAFVGGTWRQGADGIIMPPAQVAEEYLAFATTKAYGDFEAEFEFRHDAVFTDAAFLFRAQDARHYYLVHFPCTGQQYRAKHFWAAISKIDGSGWVKVLKMDLVPGVPSEIGLWHKARLVVKGKEIRLWVDGRPFAAAQDESDTKPGCVGLASYATQGPGKHSSFRRIQIKGEAMAARPWDKTIEPRRNWFVVHPTGGTGCSNITRAPNGDLLVLTWSGELVRSRDNGRTWTSQGKLPQDLKEGLLHTSRDGRLHLHVIETTPPFTMRLGTSEDNGKTWSEPKAIGRVLFPESVKVANVYGQALLELQDGTLLRLAYSTAPGDTSTIKNGRHYRLVHDGAFNFCMRSTDGGQSWSAPVNIDGANPRPQSWTIAMEASEVSAAQTRDGKVMALTRPFTSPWMWETWSSDGGKSWAPAARGSFAMYASTSSMVSTASGALLIGGRHPGMAVQASFDDGMTWQCYRIDTTAWANGAMYQVKPDLVLYIYGGHFSPNPQLRAQFLRVTRHGLEPVAREAVGR